LDSEKALRATGAQEAKDAIKNRSLTDPLGGVSAGRPRQQSAEKLPLLVGKAHEMIREFHKENRYDFFRFSLGIERFSYRFSLARAIPTRSQANNTSEHCRGFSNNA
jgi:hypothetical protein